MRDKTYIVTVGENSSVITDLDDCRSCRSVKTIQFQDPESVYSLADHPRLYTSEQLKEARQQGENEAWELAQKILKKEQRGGYCWSELTDIFGQFENNGHSYVDACVTEHTFHEAVAKVQKWEERQIKCGDIVSFDFTDMLGLIVRCVEDENTCNVVYSDGDVGIVQKAKMHKTDKRVDNMDEFYEFLKKE